MSIKNLIGLLPRTFYLIFNLFSVYFFEYVIITSFANVMDHKMKEKYPTLLKEIHVAHFFIILNVSYQIGVFISRSSLSFFPIKKIWTLTAFQAVNFLFIFLNTRFMFTENLKILCPIFIWVGLMGGGSYVNVLHGILELKTLKKTEKESAISLSLMFNDTGILLASIASLFLDNFYFNIRWKLFI